MRASTYDELGEFHDLFMTEAWEELRPLVAATFGGLGRGAVVVEIGAGSGLGARVLAEECEAQLVALEPNLLMRSVLTARVADDLELSQRVTVVAGSAPRALSLLPDRVDGVLCTHVLGHLDPLELRSVCAWVADTLSPGGRCLVTVHRPADHAAAAPAPLARSRRLGRLEYRVLYREAAVAETFCSRYEVWDGSSLVRAVEVEGAWRPVGLAELEAAAAGTGLTVVLLGPGTALLEQPDPAAPGVSAQQDRTRAHRRARRGRRADEVGTPVRVLYSDQPGQNPPFEPRGSCPDWSSALHLVRHHLGPEMAARVMTEDAGAEVTLVYSAHGHSYRLEGPAPGPGHC